MKRSEDINVNDMLDYKDNHLRGEVMYASREFKKLTFTFDGGYKVYYKDKVVYNGRYAHIAVEQFNNL